MKKEDLLLDACKIVTGGCIGLVVGAIIQKRIDKSYEETKADSIKFDDGEYIRVNTKIYVPTNARMPWDIKYYESMIKEELEDIQRVVVEDAEANLKMGW